MVEGGHLIQCCWGRVGLGEKGREVGVEGKPTWERACGCHV